MPQYYTFYESDSKLDFTLQWQNYYRSSISRKTIKHCIEYTILKMNSNCVQVGFSCAYHQRTFISLYQYWNAIIRKVNDKESYFPCGIRYSQGDTIEACYDSTEQIMQVIKGDENCTSKITFPNPVTWFVYLDHGQNEDMSDKISLNIGKTAFHNRIPSGYQPWITGTNSHCCGTLRQSFLIFKHFHPLLFVICIFS